MWAALPLMTGAYAPVSEKRPPQSDFGQPDSERVGVGVVLVGIHARLEAGCGPPDARSPDRPVDARQRPHHGQPPDSFGARFGPSACSVGSRDVAFVAMRTWLSLGLLPVGLVAALVLLALNSLVGDLLALAWAFVLLPHGARLMIRRSAHGSDLLGDMETNYWRSGSR